MCPGSFPCLHNLRSWQSRVCVHSREPVGQLVLCVPPVMVLCAHHAVCTVYSMCAFHWPWCAACCVGSVCTVSSQGCVSFGLAVFLRFCMHWISCGPHAHCQCPELCVSCAPQNKCVPSLMRASSLALCTLGCRAQEVCSVWETSLFLLFPAASRSRV